MDTPRLFYGVEIIKRPEFLEMRVPTMAEPLLQW
jgi:hypothetical protein